MKTSVELHGIDVKEQREWSYRLLLVIDLFFFTLILFGSFHSFGIFLKPLVNEFHSTRAAVSGAISLAWVLHGVFGLVGGLLSDRFGPKRVAVVASLFVAAGYLLMSTATSLWQLYLYFGVISGMGMGPTWVVSSATTAQWFSKWRGLSVGIVLAGPGIGHIVLPPLVQLLIGSLGMRTAYLILGVIVLCIAVPLGFFLKTAPQERSDSCSSTLQPSEDGKKSVTIRSALCTWSFWLLFAIWLLVPLVIQVMKVHIFPYAVDKGHGESIASLLFIFMGVGIVAGRVGWGVLADRYGSKKTFAFILILLAACEFATIGIQPLWTFYVIAALFGFAMGGNNPVYVKLVTEFFGTRAPGAILGGLTVAFSVSAAAGPVLAGAIFDRTQSYFWAFFIAGIIVLMALAIVLLLKIPGASHFRR